VRELVTTVMEIVGGLLVVAALAVWAAAVALPLALAVAGVGMVAFSWLLTNPKAPARWCRALGARWRAVVTALVVARRRRVALRALAQRAAVSA
jgi:uncharacterized membrane protein YkgB